MMDTVQAKKRGRPAQLLQAAELQAFVEYLSKKQNLSAVEQSSFDSLVAQNYQFDKLSEPHQVLLKEALKPYREHLKLRLLFEELSKKLSHTDYEKKFMRDYERYLQNNLDASEINIMKVMCNRYQKFKTQKLAVEDLEFYLSQIQKKEIGQQRRAENHRKFELGGAVLAAYKKLDIDISKVTPEQIRISLTDAIKFSKQIRKTIIFKKIAVHESDYYEKNKQFISVVERLAEYKISDESIATIQIEKIQGRK